MAGYTPVQETTDGFFVIGIAQRQYLTSVIWLFGLHGVQAHIRIRSEWSTSVSLDEGDIEQVSIN
jgi:cellobiose-specific phosphotransferase system component IIC